MFLLKINVSLLNAPKKNFKINYKSNKKKLLF